MIVGCNQLGRLIGRIYQNEGESVVLIDTDKDACEKAKQDNLPVFESSGLDPQVMEKADITSVGTLVALTNNGDVNLMIAQRAIEEFAPPKVLAVFPKQNDNNVKANKQKINQPFINELPVKVWNQYLQDGLFRLGKTVIRGKGDAIDFQQVHIQALIASGEMLPLLVRRNGKLDIIQANEEWKLGDEIIYLLHDPRPQLLKRLSGVSASSRLNLEKLPKVEEIPLPVNIKQA